MPITQIEIPHVSHSLSNYKTPAEILASNTFVYDKLESPCFKLQTKVQKHISGPAKWTDGYIGFFPKWSRTFTEFEDSDK